MSNETKPTPIVNSRLLKYPQDRGGVTSKLRREAARSVGRIAGDEVKLKLVLDTLDVARQYALDKFEAQKETAELRRAEFARRAKLDKERVRREAEGAIKSKLDNADALTKEAAAMRKALKADPITKTIVTK